jgi:hypothetical protein
LLRYNVYFIDTLSYAFDNGIGILTKVAKNLLEVMNFFDILASFQRKVLSIEKDARLFNSGNKKYTSGGGGLG